MEEKDIKKPLSRKEIMDRIPAYMSLMVIAPIIGNSPYILQVLASKFLGLSPNNDVEEPPMMIWFYETLPTISFSLLLLFINKRFCVSRSA